MHFFDRPLRSDALPSTARFYEEPQTEFPWHSLATDLSMTPRDAHNGFLPSQRSSSLRQSTSAEDLMLEPTQDPAASDNLMQTSPEDSPDARARSLSFTEQFMGGWADFGNAALAEGAFEDPAQRKQPHVDDDGPGRVSFPSVPFDSAQPAIASALRISPGMHSGVANGPHATLSPQMLIPSIPFAAHKTPTPPHSYEAYRGRQHEYHALMTRERYNGDNSHSSDELSGDDDSPELPHADISVLQPPSSACDPHQQWFPPSLAFPPPMLFASHHPVPSVNPMEVGGAPVVSSNATLPGEAQSPSVSTQKPLPPTSGSCSPPSGDHDKPKDTSMSQSLSASSKNTTTSPSDSASPEIPAAPKTNTPNHSGDSIATNGNNKRPGPSMSPSRRVAAACGFCKHRKLRCSGERPHCAECISRGQEECEYPIQVRRRGKAKRTLEREARQKDLKHAKQQFAEGLIDEGKLEEVRAAARDAERAPCKKRKCTDTATKASRKSREYSSSE